MTKNVLDITRLKEELQKSGIDKIRVCMLLPALKIGGGEVAVMHLLKYLDKSIFDVSVCTLRKNDPTMEKEARTYVESIYSLGFRWRYFPISFIRLFRYLRRGKFDIIHTHLALADAIGRVAGWMAGIPIRMTTEQGKYLWKSQLFLILERLLSHITDMRICVSRDIVELRRTREGTPYEKLKYIPNSVDIEKFEKPSKNGAEVRVDFGWNPDDPLIVSVGRLVSAKNYPLLMEALALLSDHHPTLKCLLVGEGDCREEITTKIKALGIEDKVILAGSRYDIPDLVAAADVFVLSSLREGTPLSLLEAMALGKAVVGTSVGGIAETITNGENGLLVPSEDAQALAVAMEKLLRDGELQRKLGQAAIETVSNTFSARVTTESVAEIYIELYKRKVLTRRLECALQ